MVRISSRRSFTLIELLVVVAIIAVLVAVLLPALAAAREQGWRTVCASNQRQVGLAMQAYANDYGGWYPPTYGPYPGWGAYASWADFLTQTKCVAMPNPRARTNVFRCPASTFAVDWTNGFYYRTFAVNDYSWRSGNPPTYGAYRVDEFVRAADTVHLCEEGDFVMDGVVNSGNFAVYPPIGMDFLHQERMNVLWADGHVSLLARTDTRPGLFTLSPDD